MRVALTGGIACGKSLVARYLNELGVETLDADDIVHELLPDPAERKRIAAEVFADPEKRKALEAKVHPLVKGRINAFLGQSRATSVESRSFGEAGTPPLRRCGVPPHQNGCRSGVPPHQNGCRSGVPPHQNGCRCGVPPHQNGCLAAAFRLRPRVAIIPLLFETHWDSDYDIICTVRSSRETQVRRMMTTRGYTREEAEARLAAQLPVEEKAAKSHYVIENDGSEEELRRKVAGFVEWMRRRRRKGEIVESVESVESSNRRA